MRLQLFSTLGGGGGLYLTQVKPRLVRPTKLAIATGWEPLRRLLLAVTFD
jgi:hypothetical protein